MDAPFEWIANPNLTGSMPRSLENEHERGALVNRHTSPFIHLQTCVYASPSIHTNGSCAARFRPLAIPFYHQKRNHQPAVHHCATSGSTILVLLLSRLADTQTL